MNLKKRQEDADEKRDIDMKSYRANLQRVAAFEAEVAAWAIGLSCHSTHRHEFTAEPVMTYSHDDEPEGLEWKIKTGTPYRLVVKARTYSIHHIMAKLVVPEVQLYMPHGEYELSHSLGDPEKAIEMAEAILDTFDGHVVAEWWPTERQTYARWIADGRPQWRVNPEPWVSPHVESD